MTLPAAGSPILRLITKSVFCLAARRTSLNARAPQPGSAPVSEKRVGLSRCPRCSGYWAFNGLGSFGSARDRGFPFSGLAPFGTPTGHSSCQRRPRLTLQPHIGTLTTCPAQASRPRSGGRFCFARFGRLVWAHDVSGTGWQTLGRAMQSITTMVPIWQ